MNLDLAGSMETQDKKNRHMSQITAVSAASRSVETSDNSTCSEVGLHRRRGRRRRGLGAHSALQSTLHRILEGLRLQAHGCGSCRAA